MPPQRRIAFSAVGQIGHLRNEAAFQDADEDVFEDGNGKSENLDHVLQRGSTKLQLITMYAIYLRKGTPRSVEHPPPMRSGPSSPITKVG